MIFVERSHTCGELNEQCEGMSVTLAGWVHRARDHGGVQFIDLRDRYGITQVVIPPESSELRNIVGKIKMESCIAVFGAVSLRPQSMANSDLSTGAIEVLAENIEILSSCETLPFMIAERSDARDELRQQFRFLDLRSFSMLRKIVMRHKVAQQTRAYLNEAGFLEIETPTLIRSTPEGARDCVVPSRLHRGRFYALPQSPQLFKQLLMVAGADRYYQIARCYRDEDTRGDRQLEFSQIDLEMSFATPDQIYRHMEKNAWAHIFCLPRRASARYISSIDLPRRDRSLWKRQTRPAFRNAAPRLLAMGAKQLL